MKYYLLTFVLSGLLSFNANAQTWFGMGAGPTVGHTFLSESSYVVGYRAEMVFPIELSKTSMFDIGIRASQLGYNDKLANDGFEDVLYNFQEVEASFVYKMFFGGRRATVRPFLGGGAKAGFMLAGTIEGYPEDAASAPNVLINYNKDADAWDNVNRLRYGLVGEAGLGFKTGKTSMLQIGLVYDFELAQVFTEESGVGDENNSFLGCLALMTRLAIRL